MPENPFLAALHCKNHGRPPVWLMRQAGRYLPEYRAIRERHTFLEMCHQCEVAAEVTRLPVQILGVDAAILFADILLILEPFKRGLRFEEGVGPLFERPVRNAEDVAQLPSFSVEESLGFVEKTIRLLKKDLTVPLIGFAGAPFTVASYLIEGRSSQDLKKTRQWIYRDPESFHRLLEVIADYTIAYLRMQAQAGAQALQIFDSWANFLGPQHFHSFSRHYIQKVLDGLRDLSVPIIIFARGSSMHAEEWIPLRPSAISLDWTCDLVQLRRKIPHEICLQGNFDPFLLYAPLETIQKNVLSTLKKMKSEKGYIANLGHGISPDVSVDAVRTFVDTVKNS